MKTSHRFYAEENGDFNLICRFYTQNGPYFRQYSTWSLARIVDWKYGIYDNKRAFAAFCDENAHLWFDSYGNLAGAVISENGDAGFVILSLPGYRFLYEEMLAWVLEAWQARGPKFETEITEPMTIEAGALERYGFSTGDPFYTRRFDLTGDLVPRFPLEAGFCVVDMAAHPDYRGQRLMRSNAFRNKETLTEAEMQEELKFTNHAHNGPMYHAPTDLCVMSEDGTIVSGCEALINGINCEADIERVATHSNYRKRGFARAAIQECMYRLRDMGIANAYITGYSQAAIALYGSLGAVDELKNYTYQRP